MTRPNIPGPNNPNTPVQSDDEMDSPSQTVRVHLKRVAYSYLDLPRNALPLDLSKTALTMEQDLAAWSIARALDDNYEDPWEVWAVDALENGRVSDTLWEKEDET